MRIRRRRGTIQGAVLWISSKLNQLLELQERLANFPALKAAEKAARQFYESQALAAEATGELPGAEGRKWWNFATAGRLAS